MRVDLQTSPVERSDDFQEIAFHIPKEEMAKVAELVIKRLYESEIRFVVELVANAYDAAPGAAPVIHWPTLEEPWFEVEDIGPGMSAEFMATTYSQIFSSTKDKDDTKIGGWGMGRLSALAISESYGIISDDGLTRRIYSVFKGEMGMPTLALLSSGPSQGPGTKVTVPVPDNKIDTVRREGAKLLPFFSPAPLSNMQIEPIKIAYAHPNGQWKLRERGGPIDGNYVVMGGYPYPIDADSLPWNNPGRSLFQKNNGLNRILVELPINACDVTSNRERLRYTEKTNAALGGIAKNLITEFHESLREMVEAQPTFYEATREYGRLLSELPQDLKKATQGKLTWKGQEVNDAINLRPHDFSNLVPFQTGVKFFINAGKGGRSRTSRYAKPMRPKWDMVNSEHVWPWDKEGKTVIVMVDKPIKAVLPTISYNLEVGARVYAVYPQENVSLFQQLERLGNPPADVVQWITDMEEPPKEVRSRQSGPKVKVKLRDFGAKCWNDEFSWDTKTGGVYIDFVDGEPITYPLINLAQEVPGLRPVELIGIPRSSFKSRAGYTKLEDHMRPIAKATLIKRNLKLMADLREWSRHGNDWEIRRLLQHAGSLKELKPILKLRKTAQENAALTPWLTNLNQINNNLGLNYELPAPSVDIQAILKDLKEKHKVLIEVLSNIDNPSKELIACIL